MADKRPIHVVPHGDGWAAIRSGGSRHTHVAKTQREVIDAARQTARHNGTELLIHGTDGRIRQRDSYGSDPFPPRG